MNELKEHFGKEDEKEALAGFTKIKKWKKQTCIFSTGFYILKRIRHK